MKLEGYLAMKTPAPRSNKHCFAKITVIATLFLASATCFAASPCDENPQACHVVWDSNQQTFASNNIVLNGTHGNSVNCNPERDDTLSNENKTLTIHYSRDEDKKNTCYTMISNLITTKNKNTTHGYIETDIIIDNDLPGELNTQQTWPAFWLVGKEKKAADPSETWPTQGEIDIAEYVTPITKTVLHGGDRLQPAPADWADTDLPLGKLTPGLMDNHHVHKYGIEWQLVDDENMLILCIYYDGIYQYGIEHNTNERPYAQIKRGLKNGDMVVMFDADQGPDSSWIDNIKYSMTISNLKVYSIES